MAWIAACFMAPAEAENGIGLMDLLPVPQLSPSACHYGGSGATMVQWKRNYGARIAVRSYSATEPVN